MHLGKSHLGVFMAVGSLEKTKNRKIKQQEKYSACHQKKNIEGTVKSCSGHYLPFKIITFERSENIFDVSSHLVQKKKKLFLDAEAKEGTLPGRALSLQILSAGSVDWRKATKATRHHIPTVPTWHQTSPTLLAKGQLTSDPQHVPGTTKPCQPSPKLFP